MLSHAYFLAKFRFDTVKNEPAKILENFAKNAISNFVNFANRIRRRSCKIFANFWRARSRLYQIELLQEYQQDLDEIDKMHIL